MQNNSTIFNNSDSHELIEWGTSIDGKGFVITLNKRRDVYVLSYESYKQEIMVGIGETPETSIDRIADFMRSNPVQSYLPVMAGEFQGIPVVSLYNFTKGRYNDDVIVVIGDHEFGIPCGPDAPAHAALHATMMWLDIKVTPDLADLIIKAQQLEKDLEQDDLPFHVEKKISDIIEFCNDTILMKLGAH